MPETPDEIAEQIGTGDVRYREIKSGGFVSVELYDADDYDLFIVPEDSIVALRDRLNKTIEEHNL